MKIPQTVGGMYELRSEVLSNDNIVNFDFDTIGKHFFNIFQFEISKSNWEKVYNFSSIIKRFFLYLLNKFVPKYIFQLNKKYLYSLNIPETIPNEEKAFYKFVCEYFFDLDKLPKYEYSMFYATANNDIKEIEERIITYKKELKKIVEKFKNKTFTENDNMLKYLYKHYIELNENALNEIRIFLKKNIFHEAKIRSILPNMNYFRVPYNYKWFTKKYKLESLSIINNKFLNISYREHLRLREICSETNQYFINFLKNYINEEKIIDKIKISIDNHYLLNDRKEILDEILNLFLNDKKLLFVNLVPLQIEGLIYDYCVAIGIEEYKLKLASINEKLNYIIQFDNQFNDYEYYSFLFPLLRNKVAHGKKITNIDFISDILLLDLYDICEKIKSNNIEMNFIINFYQSINDAFNFKTLLKFSFIIDIQLPNFYNLTQIHSILKNEIHKDLFFEKIDTLATNTSYDIIKEALKFLIIKLKINKINTEKCISFLKKFSDIERNKFEIKEFFKLVDDLED